MRATRSWAVVSSAPSPRLFQTESQWSSASLRSSQMGASRCATCLSCSRPGQGQHRQPSLCLHAVDPSRKLNKPASYLGSGHGPFARRRGSSASNSAMVVRLTSSACPFPWLTGRDRCSVSPVFPVSTISGSKAAVASATKSFTSSISLRYAQPSVSVCKQAREGTTGKAQPRPWLTQQKRVDNMLATVHASSSSSTVSRCL